MAFHNKVPLYRLPIFRVLVIQALVTLGMAFVFFIFKGSNAGLSALLGGMIALIPNTYFALKTFRYFGAQSAVAVTLSLWAGEAGKFVLTAVLFVLVFFTIKPIHLMALFITYFFVLVVASFGLLLVKKRFKKY